MSTGTATRAASRPAITRASTHEDMLHAAQFGLRDTIDQYRDLTQSQRRAVLVATAAYLADLRAAGVQITSPASAGGPPLSRQPR